MATVIIASVLDNTCTIAYDLDTTGTTVTGVEVVNNSTQTVTATVIRPTGQVVNRSVTPGTNASVSIPKGKQFPLQNSPWTVTLVVG